MVFQRAWDFNQGNRMITLHDLRYDDEVQEVLGEMTGGGSFATMMPGTTLTVHYVPGTGWPDRPTDRTDLIVVWTGGDENNPPLGAAVGTDKWDRPVS